MKYLFTYAYGGSRVGGGVSGQGSLIMTADADKITESMIYGEGGACDIAKDGLLKEGIRKVTVSPMGWFKFDKEETE